MPRAGIHLAVLWSFAFAQPLFGVLADSPEFFVARGNGAADILILAFGLVLLPPLAMVLVELLAGLVRRSLRAAIHLLLIGALVAALALQLASELLAGPAGALIALAALAGAAGAVAYARSRLVPATLSVLGVAPAIFLLLFLVVSPVSKLALPGEQVEAAPATTGASAPVVVIVFDELPAISLMNGRGEIDRSRFPSFAELADTATWYRNATTVAELTPQAVPALLSGSTPDRGTLPTASEVPDNLFTLLGEDYRLAVHETSTTICPEELCEVRAVPRLDRRLADLVADLSIVSGHLLLPDSLASELPSVADTFDDFAGDGLDDVGGDRAGGRRVERERLGRLQAKRGPRVRPFEAMLSAIDGSDRSLYFVHLSIPHVPWNFLPDGSRYPLPDADPYSFEPGQPARWPASPEAIRHGQQRHLLQVGLADRLLGELIERLRREGIWDRALVAVVADHGTAFRPGDFRRVPTEGNLAEVANVPMIVKAPGQRRGRTVDARVRTIDLLPTIARELGVRIPFEVEGEPAPRRGAPTGPVTVVGRTGERVSLPLERLVGARDRIARRRARELGAGGGWATLFRLGPHAELIGTRIAALPIVPGTAGELSLELEPSYLDLRPGSLIVPAVISGRLSGSIEPGTPIAIAVNGRIAAIGHAYADGERTRLAAIVPPRAYRVGENRLRAFAIPPDGRLQRVASG